MISRLVTEEAEISPLRALVIRHCASLGERVSTLAAIVSGLAGAADRSGQVAEARALAHQIVGASGSIGFDELSACAAALEARLVALKTRGAGVGPAMLEEVAALSTELKRLATGTKPEHSRLYNTDLAAAADANTRDRAKAV